MSGLQKYPECDLCTAFECSDEKVSQIFEDVDFTKQFLLNMKSRNFDDIANDCYLMAEVVSGKSDPQDIAEAAFCIYVSLAQLVEMDAQRRMEIAIMFKESLDKISGNIGNDRKVSKKTAIVDEHLDLDTDARSFLDQLDGEIADLEAISSQFETRTSTPSTAVTPTMAAPISQHASKPSTQAAPHKGLKPVIGKLGAPISGGIKLPTTRPLGGTGSTAVQQGTRENPIKLTPEMIQGAMTDKDMVIINKGIKIKRTEIVTFTPPITRPPPLKLGGPFMPRSESPPAQTPQASVIPFLNVGSETSQPRQPPRPDSPTLSFSSETSQPKKPSGMELPKLAMDEEDEVEEKKARPKPKPVGSKLSLDLADPFELQEERIFKEKAEEKAEAETPLKLCHNCKTLNKITNKACTRCGYFF